MQLLTIYCNYYIIKTSAKYFLIMIQYTNAQQARILNTCTNATELLEMKELIEELQPIAPVAQLVFDRMMNYFFVNNKIVWILQN